MGRGRPRKPREQQELSGQIDKRPARYKDYARSPEAILFSELKCPVKYRPDTKRAWQSIVPTLINLGVLSEQDVPTLQFMFRLFESAIKADEELERVEKIDDLDPMDRLVLIEKYTNLRNKSWSEFAKASARYGITPTERTKLQLPDKKEKSDDPLDIILGAV